MSGQSSSIHAAPLSHAQRVADARGIDPLTAAAIVHGTDKYGYHDYTPNYFRVLGHLRDRPLSLLEIGVGGYADEDRGGESLVVWRDFFPQAQVTGLDIQRKSLSLGPRVKVMQGSQIDPALLNQVVAERGRFDVIIDDGSHRNEHVVESFRLLFPGLAPGGIYLIEDVQTAFFPRFGGSLELAEPNSVGHFVRAMMQMSRPHDAVFADVAAVERFHNMIVLHKAQPGAVPRGLADSTHLRRAGEGIGDRPLRVALIGGATLPQPFEGRAVEVQRPDGSASWGRDDLSALDLIVLRLDEAVRDHEPLLRKMLAALRADGGVLAVTTDKPARDLAEDSPVMTFARRRFVEIDHREMRVHFPEADIDPLAREIHSLERTVEALVLVRAPNDFPSNFAYDPANPQAAEALSHMRAVLAETDVEGGLVHLLQIEARLGSPEAAQAIEARLEALGATARRYFEQAILRSTRERDASRTEALLERALSCFPCDPRFTAGLARHRFRQRRIDEALQLVEAGLVGAPGDRVLNALMAQLLVANKAIREALPYAREAAARTPRIHRSARQIYYCRLLRQLGEWAEADRYLSRAIEISPGDAELEAEMALVRSRQSG
jgi:hypothetical protein